MTAALLHGGLPFVLVFARAATLMFAAPLVGDALPRRLRVAVAVVLAAVLGPLRAAPSLDAAPMAIGLEIIFGLAVGTLVRLLMSAAESGGQLIGLSLELGFAGTVDPLSREESLPTRRIASALAGIAFLAAGGLESLVRALVIPPATSDSLRHVGRAAIHAAGEVLPVGLRLAAPVLLAAVVANLSVALASRAAPALNIFSVMLAAALLVGGVVLFATAPALASDLLSIARHAAHAL